MAKEIVVHSDISRIERVFLPDSSSTTGAGLASLTEASSGLIIATMTDVESSATDVVYTAAGSTIEDVTTGGTIGVYAAPTATKCRFEEINATDFPGLYEIQLANARYAVTNAEKLVICISGATNLAPTYMEIQLTQFDIQGTPVVTTDIWSDGVAPVGQDVIDAMTAAFIRAISGIVIGTASGVPTTTVIATSTLLPVAAVIDQFKGRVLTFADDTTTTNLRGQTTVIQSNTAAGVITVTALTTAPVSGDTFTIQ